MLGDVVTNKDYGFYICPNSSKDKSKDNYEAIMDKTQNAIKHQEEFSLCERVYWKAVKSNNSVERNAILKKMQSLAEQAAADWGKIATMCYNARQQMRRNK